ncbi:MAG: hypothetical protein JKZ03_06345 [Flavobacteriaceae bacterium]|nr:hypothetical protein [Flavobacteriaceae bacterium]
MKKKVLTLMALMVLISCKNKEADTTSTTIEETVKKEYPALLSSIFEAHGGIDAWNSMQHLSYEIVKPEKNEIHNVALKSRQATIDYGSFKIGFDGQKPWISDSTKMPVARVKYQYDLMFFFYALPFLFGDDGIVYSEVAPLEFDGISYPGLMISYNTGVGASPNDQYIIYQDPNTKEMAWLAYTATFEGTEKSTDFHYIKYSEWGVTNGLKLPTTLSWFKVVDGLPTEKQMDRSFINTGLLDTAKDASMFNKPEGGVYSE